MKIGYIMENEVIKMYYKREKYLSCDECIVAIRRFKWFSKYVIQDSKVLDIGSKTGQLNQYLSKLVDYTILEISARKSNYLRKKGFKVIKADICDKNLGKKFSKKFDFIIIGEILEHLPNPFQALINVRKMLKNKGVVLSSTPNTLDWQAILREIFFKKPESLKKYKRHILSFNRQTLKNLLTFAGFKPVVISKFCRLPRTQIRCLLIFWENT